MLGEGVAKKGKLIAIYALRILRRIISVGSAGRIFLIMAAGVDGGRPMCTVKEVLELRATVSQRLETVMTKGDRVIVTVIPTGLVEKATVNWATDEACGVTYDGGGCHVLPLLPHADNSEIYRVALDKSCKTCYSKTRGNK